MKTFGLTGGIGMGKSTCAELLRQRGIAVVDTDDLARQVVAPGQPALQEVIATFGGSVLDTTGQLDRPALARLVFTDPVALRKLEAILHPRIITAWTAQLDLWRTAGVPIAVVVIPLLFETGAEARFDATVCLACTLQTQHARLQARGWSSDEIARRSAAQMSVEEKLARSNFAIWTEGSLESHAAQLEKIFVRH